MLVWFGLTFWLPILVEASKNKLKIEDADVFFPVGERRIKEPSMGVQYNIHITRHRIGMPISLAGASKPETRRVEMLLGQDHPPGAATK
jgi:hypothetical protein